MPNSVVLTVQRQLCPDILADALAEAGAEAIRVENGSGDSGAGVARYFNFLFADPGAAIVQRAAQGFVALGSEEHPDGWTHLRLGADGRGRHFIVALAETLGGETYDERTGEKLAFDPPAVPAMR